MRNVLPPRPPRSCWKIASPGLSSFTAIAVAISSGDNTTKAEDDAKISKARFAQPPTGATFAASPTSLALRTTSTGGGGSETIGGTGGVMAVRRGRALGARTGAAALALSSLAFGISCIATPLGSPLLQRASQLFH